MEKFGVRSLPLTLTLKKCATWESLKFNKTVLYAKWRRPPAVNSGTARHLEKQSCSICFPSTHFQG